MIATLPTKGTVWLHARRKDIDGNPVALTVTSITNGKVYSRTRYGGRVKTPADKFSDYCLEIVSVPEKVKASAPKFTEAEAKDLFARAQEAGRIAAEAITPEPMYVVRRENPLDDTSPIVKRYPPVLDGVCGFAWVLIKPGNSSLARQLKALGLARTDSYYGGVSIWISGYGQSYERKLAHAAAAAKVFQEAGVKAMSMGRLD